MSLFGPLFRYELTRLARRGLQPKLRAAFAGLLLVALLLAYLAAFPGTSPLHLLTEIDQPLTLEAASRFGERFLVSFLFIQIVVVLLVTPPIAAGAIGEDKERGALDLLLTTSLSSTEILLGKLAARLVFVGSLLFTGLPVVTLIIFFGGVDIGQLVAGYAIAALTILSLSAIAVAASVVLDTLGSAIIRAYTFALLFSLIGIVGMCFEYPAYLSPVATTWALLNGWPALKTSRPANPLHLVGIYAAVHLFITALFVAYAALGLRRVYQQTDATRVKRILEALAEYENLPPIIVKELRESRQRRWTPRVWDDDPFGWKERHFGGAFTGMQTTGAAWTYVLLALLGGCVLCCGLSRYFVVIGFAAALALIGIGAAASIARERQLGTLDGLLTLPRDRSELLWAKLRRAARSSAWVAIPAFGFGLLAAWIRAEGGLILLAIPVVFSGWMLASGGFGMWLSVRCPTRGAAVAWFFAISVTLSILVPLAAAIVESGRGVDSHLTAAFVRGLGPITGLWNLDPKTWDWTYAPNAEVQTVRQTGSVLGALVAALVGLIFLRLAAQRLERNE